MEERIEAEQHKRLVEGYLNKTLTKEELEVFFDLLPTGILDEYMLADMDLTERSSSRVAVKKTNYLKYAAALVILGFSALLYQYVKPDSKLVEKVLPGTEFAVLKMGDGTEIVLDTNITGVIKAENGLVLSKLADGTVKYDLSGLKNESGSNLLVENSVLETPKGGIHHIVLSDGTNVWLNASSKLKFPLIFRGDSRTVEMEGEVYFDVKSDKRKPFVVKSTGQEIKVLGTSFNVNAYSNEPSVKTVLLEGSVSVFAAGVNKIIRPGEQSSLTTRGLEVSTVDVADAVAWKVGYFNFDKLFVKDIMRQIERWYNVDVIYEDGFRDERFVAKMKRSAGIDEVIAVFNEGGLKVRLKGRKLHVSN